MAKGLCGVHHAHGCARCTTRYMDACAQPGTNALCTACSGGLPWQTLIDSALPRECCRELARLVTKDEKVSYRLAGSTLWFICSRCARTHPFDPRKRTP